MLGTYYVHRYLLYLAIPSTPPLPPSHQLLLGLRRRRIAGKLSGVGVGMSHDATDGRKEGREERWDQVYARNKDDDRRATLQGFVCGSSERAVKVITFTLKVIPERDPRRKEIRNSSWTNLNW